MKKEERELAEEYGDGLNLAYCAYLNSIFYIPTPLMIEFCHTLF